MRKNEYSFALDMLIELETMLQKNDVPEERYEMLLNKAHLLIRKQSDIEELMEIFVKLARLAQA